MTVLQEGKLELVSAELALVATAVDMVTHASLQQ